MAQKTFLELVNKVLIKLRETQVTTVSSSAYSTLIGEFVNDAKKDVENAWPWRVNRSTINFTSDGVTSAFDVSQGSSYAHTGTLTNEYSLLVYDNDDCPMAFDITTGQEMQLTEWTLDYMASERILNPTSNISAPAEFSLNSSTGDGFQIQFMNAPAAGRSYRIYFNTPQEDLVNDTDVLTIPWRPVVNGAVRYALAERGEEIGEPGNDAERKYLNSLADAIAIDSRPDTSKTDFKAY